MGVGDLEIANKQGGYELKSGFWDNGKLTFDKDLVVNAHNLNMDELRNGEERVAYKNGIM